VGVSSSSEDLKKMREKRYPSYVNKMAEVMKLAPYQLMPLWNSVLKTLGKEESFHKLSDLSTYIKVSKAFREVLISRELLTMKDIERHLNAPAPSA